MTLATPTRFPQLQVRRVTQNLDYLRIPLNASERADKQGDVPYWGANGVVDHVNEPLVNRHVVLVGEDGAPFLDPLKPVAFAVNEPIWPNNHIHVLGVPAGNNPQYIAYALNSVDYSLYIKGSTRDKLNQSELSSIEIPIPNVSTQQAIADYLDRETAEIDKLIANFELFDDIYSERQMAQVSDLIAYPTDLNTSHAYSSGIVKIKYLGDIALGKMLDTRQADADSTTHPYLRAANVQPMGKLALEDIKCMRFTHREAEHLTVKGGDVLVVEGGVGGYGRAAYISEDIPATGFQNSILRLRPHTHADGRFITYALLLLRQRGYMKMAASVTSMPHFTVDKLANTPIPLMDLTRQTEIADELDAMWQRVDAVRDEGKCAIALARERRAALITAAVTGQIDVTARNKPAAEQLEDDIAQGLHREN